MTKNYTLWVDVEDIFQYFEKNARPSGIQRLVFEILSVIRKQATLRDDIGEIILTRRQQPVSPAETPLFSPVSFEALDAMFAKRTEDPTATDSKSTTVSIPNDHRKIIQRLRHGVIRRIESMPPEIARPLLNIAVNQLRAIRLLNRYVLNRLRRAPSAPSPAAGPITAPAESSSSASGTLRAPRPGDIFLILGAAWSEPEFGERLARMRKVYGLQPVLLIYDLIPTLRPEWCALSLVRDFRHWLDTTLPQCGRLLAISNSTASSVETYAAQRHLKLLAPVRTIPIGSGFGPPRKIEGERPLGLPRKNSYVLFVSTLEARKNHLLAFRIWRRLVSELPSDDVPTLIFAGRVGWLVSDLMQQLENTEWLRGKIRLLRDPSDNELAHLYDGCLFTLFPSLYEGWGLPVTESLVNGRPCIASNSTSIPEAGGPLTRYFDPENFADAYSVVRDTLLDRPGLEAWREHVRTEFKPVPWESSADAILDACHDAHLAVSQIK